jgi:phage gpG-like protein
MSTPTLTLTQNTMTPDLARKLAVAKSPEVVWRAAGTQVLSITKRAFREPSMRQQSWPAKRSGDASNLIAKGTLLSSVRMTDVSSTGVSLGSDRPYARIHQLGGIIRPVSAKALRFFSGGKWWTVKQVKMPARPYFPFTPAGDIAPQHKQRIQMIVDKAMRIRLGIA